MASRRILYHFVSPLEITVGAGEPARRRAFLQHFADGDTEVEVASPRMGRNSIESAWDAAIVGPYIIEGLLAAEEDGYDAVIIGCFSDPVLDAAREAVAIPVIGPGMAAIHMALQFGDRVSIISPNEGDSGRSRALMRNMGLEDRLASARGMGLSVPDLAASNMSAVDRVSATAETCIEVDEADVLVLGCMSMAFLDASTSVGSQLGVPLVNPVIASLKMAEMAALHGLSHSRVRWPKAAAKPVYSLNE